MLGYSVKQLLKYHAYCVANPDGKVLPPGGQRGWDDMPAVSWLAWFVNCLMTKINRNIPPVGKGNKAKRKMKAIADANAECDWCGTKTGSTSKRFCSGNCAIAYNS